MSSIGFQFPNPEEMQPNYDMKAMEAAKKAILDMLRNEYMKPKEDFLRETLEWLMGKKAADRLAKKQDLRDFRRLRLAIHDNIHKELNLEIITVLQRGKVKAQRVFPYACAKDYFRPMPEGILI